eukprot:15389216-Alexandrium_andersonii.AAC.1
MPRAQCAPALPYTGAQELAQAQTGRGHVHRDSRLRTRCEKAFVICAQATNVCLIRRCRAACCASGWRTAGVLVR